MHEDAFAWVEGRIALGLATAFRGAMKSSRWVPLGLFLLLAFAAAVIGALATYSGVQTWYPVLQKPAWTPPDWVFAPVWTLLYIAMAVAGWRAWRSETPFGARMIFRLYAAQLALNAFWSILFFGFQRPGVALIEIIVLWLVLIRILVRFRETDRVAAWLWAPYVLWVSFAAVLNAAIWDLNH
jgi:tryptophan-rich sensory protein